MRCLKCGELIPENSSHCAYCGADLSGDNKGTPEPPKSGNTFASQTTFTQNAGKPGSDSQGNSPVQVNVVLGSNIPPNSQQTPAASGNGVLVLLLNIFFPGIGTIVAGYGGRGIAQILLYFLVGVPLCFVGVGFIIILAIWIWALVDAVNYMNKGYI